MDESNKFRFYVFDPPLIILQIIAVQSFYYVALALWLHMVAVGPNTPLSTRLLFTDEAMEAWAVKAAYLICAPIAGALLGWIVGRAKQCLDFAATIHVMHLLVTWVCSGGFPKSLSWWAVNLICAGITAVSGEYVCMNINVGAIRVTGAARKEPRRIRPSDR